MELRGFCCLWRGPGARVTDDVEDIDCAVFVVEAEFPVLDAAGVLVVVVD